MPRQVENWAEIGFTIYDQHLMTTTRHSPIVVDEISECHLRVATIYQLPRMDATLYSMHNELGPTTQTNPKDPT